MGTCDGPGSSIQAPPRNPSPSQRELLAAAQRGDPEAQRQIVEKNLRLVGSIVQRFLHRIPPQGGAALDAEDLFQVGCVGLLKAVRGFDLDQPVRFSTYAVPVIIGEIRRYLRDQQPLRVGRTLRDVALRVAACREQLTQELGRSPSVDDIASSLGLTREDVVAAEGALVRPESLDGGGGEVEPQSESNWHERLGGGEHVYSLLVENLALGQALRTMADWERQLVVMRYFQQRPQREVAEALGVSQAYVSRAERRILARLRRLLT